MQTKVVKYSLVIFAIALLGYTTANYVLTYLGNTAESGQYKYFIPKEGINDTLTGKRMVVDSAWKQTDSTMRFESGDGTYDVKALSYTFYTSGVQTYSG